MTDLQSVLETPCDKYYLRGLASKLRQQLNKAFHLHGFIILLFIP